MATSLLILVSALAFVVFWFRQTCSYLLRNQPPLEREDAVLEADRAPVRVFREALRVRLAATSDRDAQLQALERDFRSLRYLLRRTSSARLGSYSQAERMLIVDFQVTRAALRFRSLFCRPDGGPCFERLHDTLDYFTGVLQQRLGAALESFGPLPAFAAAGAGAAQLTVCSYCLHVRQPETERWIATGRFKRSAGTGPVALSHGMCPDCYEHLVRPTLPRTVVNP